MKAFLFSSCLVLSAFTFGQKHSISMSYKPSLTCFGKQSQNFDNYYFTSRKGNQTFNNSFNILYRYRIFSELSVVTGLEYSQQGQKINFNADSAFPSAKRQVLKIELNYLGIPFTINYAVLKGKKSELNIYSGISLGIAVKRKDNYQALILEDILLPTA
jgi:hypothetical protein